MPKSKIFSFFLAKSLPCRLLISLAVVYLFVSTVVGSSAKSKTIFNSKRSIPYPGESILRKFDVRPNSIILTLESRSMGAKYINETETASNEECLLWCWQHSDCNVAVFEEVMRRSCFLFNCGPPADFRCKFTGHNFYTSSFLKATQHSYDLKQWSKEAKEENELAEKQEKQVPPHETMDTSPPPSTTAVAVLSSPALVASTLAVEPEKKTEAPMCRHYQFQCLNKSECIAIYNVCDGIPQCPDGSDESDELHCPQRGLQVIRPPQKPAESKEPAIQPPVQHVNHPVENIVTPPQQLEPHFQVTQVVPVSPPVHAKPDLPVQNKHQTHQHHAVNLVKDNEQILGGSADAAAMYREGYKNPKSSQGLYYDAVADMPDSLHSPFAHRHSKFVAANDPRLQYPSRWPEDYERYQQKSAVPDQRYNPYENGYRGMSESFPKSQYPDYDRTVYDNYHPEESSVYSEQDQLPSSSYLSSDYPQANIPSPSQQGSYSSREEPYEARRMQQKPMRGEEYFPIDRTMMKQAHASHSAHEPKTDPESYMVGPDDRPQPYVQYVDMPRTDYRIIPNVRSHDMNMANSGIVADVADMYNRDEAIRKSLSQQLQALHNPSMMTDRLPGNLGNTVPPPAVLKPKGAPHLVPGTAHGGQAEKARVAGVEHHHEQQQKTHHLAHNVGPTAATDHGILAKKLTAGSAKSSETVQAHRRESNNAVIVLAMGLIITGVLVILVGCRLRTLRRKTIRRGRNLAHDADYLVNGLYL